MNAAVTGVGPRLVDYRLLFPDNSWGSWNPGTGIEAAGAELAVSLADGPEAQALVRRSVTTINSDALQKRMIVRQAIWVPSRFTGEVMAIMDVGVREFPGGAASPEAHLARNLKRDLGRRTKVLDYSANTTSLPAGEATVEQYVLRLAGEKQVQGYLCFLVFPPGACEALSLMFNTVHLNLLTTIAEQARIIADSLTVTLGEIPGGQRKAP